MAQVSRGMTARGVAPPALPASTTYKCTAAEPVALLDTSKVGADCKSKNARTFPLCTFRHCRWACRPAMAYLRDVVCCCTNNLQGDLRPNRQVQQLLGVGKVLDHHLPCLDLHKVHAEVASYV